MAESIFDTIFNLSVDVNINSQPTNTELLISSKSEHHFESIKEIFKLSSNEPIVVAGPCSVEKHEFVEATASFLKKQGVKFLRGGAYKPRTSPYEFQGLKLDGLKILKDVGTKYDLVTITEVVDTRDVEKITEHVDVLQVGARNMHNFELLKEVGASKKPVLLKRGLSATIHEFKYAAEYIALQGNRKIILCERGIRTFETQTRNTLDISSIPILKNEAKLPVIADISHSVGRKDIVNQIAKAALAVGADGIMVEVHPYPQIALSDSKQQLNFGEFTQLLKVIGFISDNLNIKI
jgi:3-deoxy-7-phosphoheptulonate synthase